MLNLHPGPNGEYSVLRWTAQSKGTYHIEADFLGIDQLPGTTSEVTVLHNDNELFRADVSGKGASQHFADANLQVEQGDVLDVCVGWGANQSFASDSTGVRVSIVSV
jgi:hypothetical protein